MPFSESSAIHVRRFILLSIKYFRKNSPILSNGIASGLSYRSTWLAPGDNQQFLVVSGQPLVRILAEISGVSLLAVNQQHGAADLPDIGKNRHVDERQGAGFGDSSVGVRRAAVIASRSLVIVVILTHEKRSVLGNRIDYAAVEFVTAVAVVFCALSVEPFAQLVTVIGAHGVEISVGIHAAHVVHGCRNCSLDASIDSRCIKRHASPSTNTENADALCIYIVTGGKIIDRCTEIFRIDVRRSHDNGAGRYFLPYRMDRKQSSGIHVLPMSAHTSPKLVPSRHQMGH